MSGHAQLIPLQRINTEWRNPRRIGYKTTAWHNTDGWSIRLHYTNVCSYDAATATLFVSTGGWHSGITAQRIRHGLAELGLQLLTSDLPGRWRVADYKGNAFTIRGNSIKLRRISDDTSNFGDCCWERIAPINL